MQKNLAISWFKYNYDNVYSIIPIKWTDWTAKTLSSMPLNEDEVSADNDQWKFWYLHSLSSGLKLYYTLKKRLNFIQLHNMNSNRQDCMNFVNCLALLSSVAKISIFSVFANLRVSDPLSGSTFFKLSKRTWKFVWNLAKSYVFKISTFNVFNTFLVRFIFVQFFQVNNETLATGKIP